MKAAVAKHDPFQRAQYRLRRYFALIGWLIRDGALRFRRRVAMILTANVAGMGLQLAALGLIFALAHALERDTRLTIAMIDFSPRASPGGMIAVGGAAAALLVIASFLVYSARTQCVALRRRYDEFCSKRALLLGSRLPLPGADEANRILADNGLKAIANRQARLSGRVLWVLVNGMIPLGRALAALAVMAVISWFWTAVVVALAPIAGYVLYGVNVSAARASWRQVRLADRAALAKRRVMDRLQRSAHPLEEDDADVHGLYHRGEGSKAADSFYDRFLIRERAQLVTNLFTALAIFAVLLVGGSQGLRGEMSWTVFGAYLVALRFFLTNARSMVAIFVQVSRFYPYLRSYCDFVHDVRRAERELLREDVSRRVVLDLPAWGGGDKVLMLQPGDRAWLVSPARVNRALAARLQRATRPGERRLPASYGFVSERADSDHIREQAPAAIIMSARLFQEYDESERNALLAGFGEHVLVLVTATLQDLNNSPWPVILLNEDLPAEQGWCTAEWLLAHQDVWERLAARRAKRRGDTLDEEEEDEE